ncbi:MAG: type III pantothenate kinase [Acetanaerobacterium sp.]
MVLAIDIGNTNICLGCFEGAELILTSRLYTDTDRTEDQYAIELRDIFKLYDFGGRSVEGCIIGSVVPKLTTVLSHAVEKYLHCRVLTVSAGIKTGLNLRAENPAGVGADFVCGAVGAMNKYPLPCVIFDLGTATKIFAVDKTGSFIGGSILPGVIISLEALAQRTAQLPAIGLDGTDPPLISTITVESMRSGLLYGTASMIDGMTRRYCEAFDTRPTIVATGGISASVVKYCSEDVLLDPDLVLEGLYLIYQKNV